MGQRQERRQRDVLADLELGVDDRCDAGVLVTDQVGRAAEVVVHELLEDHVANDATARPR